MSDVQLGCWLGSGKRYQLIAVEMARWAAGKERGTALPDSSAFGCDLDVVVSAATFLRARRFLVAQGVLEADGRAFCVA